MAQIRDFYVKQGSTAQTTGVFGQSSTNYLSLSGGASGQPTIVEAKTTGDTNVSINIKTIGTGTLLLNGQPFGLPGGSNGQIQYNNAGAFGGIATSGSGNVALTTSAALTTPTITGGTHTAITSLGVRSTGTGSFDLLIANTENLTTNHTLTLSLGNVDRTISLGGNITTANALTTSGNFALTLTTTAATNVTLPTAGTLATLAGAEILSSKTLTAPVINNAAVSTGSAISAGTNAQGQVPLTNDYNIITTAASNPSGVTLPVLSAGRSVTIINKGANPVNVFPASGASIDGLAANTAVSLPVNGVLTVIASSAGWYSSLNEVVSGSQVVGNISGAAALLSPGANINGTAFTGGSNITITANTPNSITFNNGGAGVASGSSFTGASAVTVSYNSVGAPSTTGTNASGTWAISISGTAANATGIATTLNSASTTGYIPWIASNTTTTGQAPQVTTALAFNSNTGALSATSFSGAGTGLTGSAASLSIGGNAATATSATTAGSVTNAVTFNATNTGAASGATFNGGAAVTVSANTIGAVPLSGGTMTGFLTLSADPTQGLHAASKNYVDAVKTGLDVKDSVRAATTGALTITARTSNTLTVGGTTFTLDSVSLNNGDRVLIKDTTTGVAGSGQNDNGFYVVGGVGSSVVLTRSTDADTGTELNSGAFTFVEEGVINADSGWVCSVTGTVTIGTTNLPFVQFSGAGSIGAGNGLIKNGSTLYFAQQASYTTGQLFYASGATTIAPLNAVAVGSVLLSAGTGTAPAWGAVQLNGASQAVAGTLQVSNGGTGAATLTGYVYGNGTGAMTASTTIPGASVSGNITGNAANVSGIVATANGGTGANLTLTQYGVVVGSTTTTMTTTTAGTAQQVLAANTGAVPSFQTLNLTYLPDAWVKRSVKLATTAQQALSGGAAFPTVDGVQVAAGDRVLLRAQTAPAENGIYVVGGIATAWTFTRASDANTASYMAESAVVVDAGSTLATKLYRTTFKLGDTVGTTAVNWFEVLDGNNFNTYAPTLSGTNATGTWSISITGAAGSATTAGSATNASNVNTTNDTSTASAVYPTWVATNAGGNQAVKTTTGLSFVPSTNTLTTTTFAGSLSGTATNATNVTTTNDNATTSGYLGWVGSNGGGNQALKTSTAFTINASNGTIGATTFSGALSGTATNATNIVVTADSSATTMYLAFVNATSGNAGSKVNASLNYVPSTGVLSTTKLVAANTVTTAGTSSTDGVFLNTNAQVQSGVFSSLTGTSLTTIDSWPAGTWRSARYTVQITDGTNYEVCDVLVVHDGSTPYVTTFGNVFNGTSSTGAFDASIGGGVVSFGFQPNASTTKKLVWTRQLLAI